MSLRIDVFMHSHAVSEDKWTELQPSQYTNFCMSIVCDKLTTIGGYDIEATKSLLCLSESTPGLQWEELLPPMSTKRVRAAAVTTPNHLVVAGGNSDSSMFSVSLRGIEILYLDSLQWSSASSSPRGLEYPCMTLCGEHLYLSNHGTIFSCSVEELLKSCKPASTNNDSVWTELGNIPVWQWASLTTLRGQVLAVGGRNQYSTRGTPTGAMDSPL